MSALPEFRAIGSIQNVHRKLECTFSYDGIQYSFTSLVVASIPNFVSKSATLFFTSPDQILPIGKFEAIVGRNYFVFYGNGATLMEGQLASEMDNTYAFDITFGGQ